MKKVLKTTLTILFLTVLSSTAWANGLSLNSMGTKALSMGGAFVALADDATAIYWNPAGLAGQKSSVQLYFTGVMPLGTYELGNLTTPFGPAPVNIDAETEKNIYPTGGAMFNYTMDKWAFGLGIYVPAGLGAQWNGDDLSNLTSGGSYLWESRIGVVALSPAVAYQVNENFSVGLAINIYYGIFNLDRPDYVDANGDGLPDSFPPVFYQYSEESTGMGFGATVGLKYSAEKFSVGATFRSATKVSMEGDASSGVLPIDSEFERDVTWPMWISGGVAYKPTKCLTLALDAQYSNWGELEKLTANYSDWGVERSFILDWDNATQIRFGAEYLTSKALALRLGYYYDPAPAPDETINILFPSSTNHVGTAGFGYYFGKYKIEGALEYLFGADREVDLAGDNMEGIHHLDVFAFSIGFGMEL